MDWFYDGQIRRYITQVVRLMSNFSVQDSNGNLKLVPVMYGDLTRQVAHIIKDNSENKVPSAPRMAVYMTGLEMDRSRTTDSSFVSKKHVRERAWDEGSNQYLNTQGQNYTVERLMPSPYTLRLTVDIWTSNTDQKLQLLEQILALFNPSFEIQTTDNYLDWTSLSVVNLEGITVSSKSIPVGVDSEIDVAQLTFSTPIYISSPVKVKKLGVIQKIITSIFDEENGSIELGLSGPQLLAWSNAPVPAEKTGTVGENSRGVETLTNTDITRNNRTVVSTTWRDYGLFITNNQAQLIDGQSVGNVSWLALLQAYPGTYQGGSSRIFLQTVESTNYIVGTIEVDPFDNTKLNITWDADTIPDDTVISGKTGIDYIIDPLRFNPTNVRVPGIRLLLLGDVGSVDNIDGASAWKNANGTDFIAKENDIVEWQIDATGDGTYKWFVVFEAAAATEVVYTTNLNTGYQYKWNNEFWVKSYEGEYSNGTWRLDLLS
jgi:hypothetical protein